jgi:hypothetical protein
VTVKIQLKVDGDNRRPLDHIRRPYMMKPEAFDAEKKTSASPLSAVLGAIEWK